MCVDVNENDHVRPKHAFRKTQLQVRTESDEVNTPQVSKEYTPGCCSTELELKTFVCNWNK